MAKGNFAALQRLTPIKTDFGKIAREQEQIEFQKRAEQRTVDKIKKDDAAKLKADERRLSDKKVQALGKMKDVYTGIDSVDEGLAYGVNAATEELIKTVEALDNMPANHPDKVKLQLKQANLLKYSDNLAKMVEAEKAWAGDLASGIQDGRYSASQNMGALQDINDKYKNANFVASFDESGRPVFNQQHGTDSQITHGFDDMFNDSWLTKPQEAFNRKGFFANTDKLGKTDDLYTDPNGGTHQTKQLSEGSIAELDNNVNNMFGTEETGATGLARAYWEDEMNGDPSKFDLEAVKTNAKESALVRHDIISKDKRDLRFELARDKAAKASAGSGRAKDLEDATANIEIMTDNGKILKRPTKFYQGGSGTTNPEEDALQFSLKKPITIKTNTGSSKEDVAVKQLAVAPDGRITYSGTKKIEYPAITATDKREAKPKQTVYVDVDSQVLTPEESNLFARDLGFANSDELNKALADKEANFGKVVEGAEVGAEAGAKAAAGGFDPTNF